MTPGCFDQLFELVKDDITHTHPHTHKMRGAVPPKLKLSSTLRFLFTGESYASFRTQRSTISQYIAVVCEAVYNRLKPLYLKVSFFIFDITDTSLCFTK